MRRPFTWPILFALAPHLLMAQAVSSRNRNWFDQSPAVTLRAIGSGIEVDNVAPAVVFGDTLAVWFERSESRVRLMNLRNGSSRTVGRAGQGPYEFSRIGRVQSWLGDSVVVLDDAQARGTVLSLTSGRGRLIRYFDADSAQGAQLVGRLASGALVTVVRSNNTQDGPDGLFRMPATYRILARERELKATASFDGGRMVRLHMSGGASIMTAPIQFSLPSALSGGQLLLISEQGDTLFRWDDLDARPTRLPVALPKQSLTAADRNRLMANWLVTLKATNDQAAALRRAVAIPSQVPLTQRLLVDSDGRVWMRFSTDASDKNGASVIQIDRDGEVTKCFKLTAQQFLFGVGSAVALIGKRTDDDLYELGIASIPSKCPYKHSLSARSKR